MQKFLSASLAAGALIALLAAQQSPAAATAAPLWDDIDETRLSVQSEDRLIRPERYRTLALDLAELQRTLADAPPEFSGAERVRIALPMPDGTAVNVLAEDSPIMAPALAQRHPGIRTFRVYGADDGNVSGRIGWTSAGFHAILFTPEGTVYIDPYSRGDAGHYQSFFRADYRRSADDNFSCGGAFSDSVAASGKTSDGKASPVNASRALVPGISGSTLRTYRLAMAANYEYTQFHSGPLPTLANKAAALNNGIVPTMNRVNGIYERDVAARMVLIPNEEDIIFDTPADPYVNEDGISMLLTNPTVIDNAIGVANYDIGHVFSTGGGGVAGLGVVCRTALGTGHKANGVTGLPAPTGDPFYVDYVAHEIGHQFGGNHTFNGSTGSCSGGNRNASTAYEVGSGSTIMAYAGICSPQNTQSNSDDLFHLKSILEITTYSQSGSGNNCAVQTATGNTPPAVDAGSDFDIPHNTPFRLTAVGDDVDGDTLTYAWEEYDLGPAGDGATDNGTWPIFRAFNAVASPVRVLPQNAEKPAGPFPYGETLPTTNRTMKFRVTARDNRIGGGGVAWDEMEVDVTTAADFAVDSPVGTDVWTGGTTATVLWTMNGTDIAPINTQFVDILLSTDGGATYPHVLATSVPNDGAHDVAVPLVASTDAVIQVAASGNIYFEISDAYTIDFPDIDGDGTTDALDNCPTTANADQSDVDADTVGDACDNCIDAANPTQCDTNSDGYGNHCDADINNNGVVNFVDLGAMKDAFLSNPGDAEWNADADLTCNDVINTSDLAIVKQQFSGPPGPSAFAP